MAPKGMITFEDSAGIDRHFFDEESPEQRLVRIAKERAEQPQGASQEELQNTAAGQILGAGALKPKTLKQQFGA